MTADSNSSPDWIPVRPGDLQKLSGQWRVAERRHEFRRSSLLAIVAVIGLGGGVAWILNGGSNHLLAFSCRDVRECAERYLAGQLTASEQQALATHLSHCPPCEEFLAKLRPQGNGEGEAAIQGRAGLVATSAPSLAFR